jgi:hypothetical protein
VFGKYKYISVRNEDLEPNSLLLDGSEYGLSHRLFFKVILQVEAELDYF